MLTMASLGGHWSSTRMFIVSDSTGKYLDHRSDQQIKCCFHPGVEVVQNFLRSLLLRVPDSMSDTERAIGLLRLEALYKAV